MEFITLIIENPIVSILVIIFTLIALPVSIYYGIKTKIKKRLSFIKKSFFLIKNGKKNFNALKLFYEDKEIENAAVSKFTIWNSGNIVINGDDIVKDRKLTISCSQEDEILEAQIIATNEETNNFTVNIIDKTHVVIDFDYIDTKEGVVVQIIHTGESELCVNCKIKGGKPIKNADSKMIFEKLSFLNEKRFIEISFVCLGLVVLIFGICTLGAILSIFSDSVRHIMFDFGSVQHGISTKEVVYISSVFLLYEILLVWLYCKAIKVRFNIGVPNKLKKYSSFDN